MSRESLEPRERRSDPITDGMPIYANHSSKKKRLLPPNWGSPSWRAVESDDDIPKDWVAIESDDDIPEDWVPLRRRSPMEDEKEMLGEG